MSSDHSVKKWLNWIAFSKPLNKKDQASVDFLNELLDTKFNLVTDQAARQKIIKILSEMPSYTLGEKLLQSYLYMMIGNISKSDNILREMINKSPYHNWTRFNSRKSIYHKVSQNKMESLLRKLSNHPVDRTVFQLFIRYLNNYYNDPYLAEILEDISFENIKLRLAYIKKTSPELVKFLLLKNMEEVKKITNLKNNSNYPYHYQFYWIWPFLAEGPYFTESVINELKELEKENYLWFIYVISNEKMRDLYFKNEGKSFIVGKRSYLRSKLESEEDFMMSLYKLIEMGDIDSSLVSITIQKISNER